MELVFLQRYDIMVNDVCNGEPKALAAASSESSKKEKRDVIFAQYFLVLNTFGVLVSSLRFTLGELARHTK